MRQIKIIGLIYLLFVGFFPSRDFPSDSGAVILHPTHHKIPYPLSQKSCDQNLEQGKAQVSGNNFHLEKAAVIVSRLPQPVVTVKRSETKKVSPAEAFGQKSSGLAYTENFKPLIAGHFSPQGAFFLSRFLNIVISIFSLLMLPLLFRKRRISRYACLSLLVFLFFGYDGKVNAQTHIQTFTSSGSFVAPLGVTTFTVECWGGGGGGSSIVSKNKRGGGGGGGAYAKGDVVVIPGNSYNVVVGVGGAANTDGGNSSFNVASVVAAGGKGGANNDLTAGIGGTLLASTGTIKYKGGNGADGEAGASSGGGGGGAGNAGNGANATGPTAGSGASLNGGDGGMGVSGATNGNAGMNYGGGGSGASRGNTGNNMQTGGAGGSGLVIITYTICPTPEIPVSMAGSSATCNQFSANWTASANANSYRLDVSTDNAFAVFVAGYQDLNVGNVTTFNITGLLPETTYYYRVRAENNCITSGSSATITCATSPSIPSAPGAITGITAQCPSLTLQTYSITPIVNATTYNWTVPDGWTITAGAGTSSITITTGASGQNGNISVTAGNVCGTSAASSLAVTVNPGTPAAPSPNSGSDADCSSISANWTASVNADSYRLDVSTINTFVSYVAGYQDLNVANVTTYSVAGLETNTTYYYRVRSVNSCGTSVNSSVITYSTTAGTAALPGTIAGSTSVCSGTNSSTLTLSGNTGSIVGWEFSADNWITTTTIPNNSATLTVSNLTETTKYRAVIQSVNCGGNVKSAEAVITVNPFSMGGSIAGSATVCSGTNSTSLTLSGHRGNIIRWESSTDNWATTTQIDNVTVSQIAFNLTTTTKYRAVVQSGSCAAVNSAEATVTVGPFTTPTLIITNPAAVCSPATVDLSAAAITTGSTAGLTFEYYTDAMATTSMGSITSSNGTYWIKGTKNNCSDIKPVTVTVHASPLPTIAGNANVCLPSAGNIYTTEPGKSNYVWNVSAGGTITAGSGSNAITVTWITDGAQTVKVNYTNANNCVAISPVLFNVTVNSPPIITLDPKNLDICQGSQSDFSAKASGFPAPTVQWQRSIDNEVTWADIPGQTLNNLNILDDVGYKYRAVYTNSCGSTYSAAALLTVSGGSFINKQPDPTIIGCLGGTALLTAKPNAHKNLTGQWQYWDGTAWINFGPLMGPSNGTLNIDYTIAVDASNAGRIFRIYFTGDCGSQISNISQLEVAIVHATNACVNVPVTFSQEGTPGGTWTITGNNINMVQDNPGKTCTFTPTTIGCYTATYTVGDCTDTKNFVVFPDAPQPPVVNAGCGPNIIVTPPTPVPPNFSVEYSFDDGVTWGTANTYTGVDNCSGYKVKSRYIFAVDCGTISAGTTNSLSCKESPATIRKVDTTPPSIICNTTIPQSVCVNTGDTYVHSGLGWNATATDICNVTSITVSLSGATTGINLSTLNGIVFNIGTTNVTWTASDGCNSSACSFTVTVNPDPVITNMTYVLCNGGSFTVTPVNVINGLVPAGTTYTWDAPVVTGGITGGVANGTASDNISGNLVNPTNTIQTATYTVTPTSGSCPGEAFTLTITINPLPTCSITGPGPLCPSSTGNIYTAPSGMASYAWSISGNGTINGAINGSSVSVTAGNCNYPLANCPFTLTLTITDINGCSSTCNQVVIVEDNVAPTFSLLSTDLSFCVNSIYSAVYNPAPTLPDYNDLTMPRPEYYSQTGTEFDLDADANNYADNCCLKSNLVLHWRVVFSAIPNPADPAHTLITKAPITDQIIKPSAYPGLEFPGDGVTFGDVIHKMYYWLEDCNGIPSAEKLVNITIKPRPNIIKMTL